MSALLLKNNEDSIIALTQVVTNAHEINLNLITVVALNAHCGNSVVERIDIISSFNVVVVNAIALNVNASINNENVQNFNSEYPYYIFPELRIGDYLFESGKGAGLL